MDIRKIDDAYSVVGQIEIDDLDVISLLGFKSIVCHRPDHEQSEQPEFSAIATRARELDIQIKHIPVSPTGLTNEAIGAMERALNELPRPILGYCRSGARSTKIYELAAQLPTTP